VGSFVDLRPLKESPAFARLFAGRSIAGIGGQLTITAVGLNVYALSRSTFAVSLVGVIALVPTILAGLYGGMIADAFDRRLVALGSALLSWASTLALAVLAWTGLQTVASLYLLSALTAVASTVLMTTQSAIQPRLLGTALLPAAAALGGIGTGIAVTLGPALGGVLVAGVGFQWCYTIDAVLFVAALAGVLTLPPLPPEGAVDRPGLASLVSGIRFLRSAPNVRMSFLVDIVAMTFGQPRVLFPAAAALLLGGGAVTVGILSAAFAIGALLSSVFSGRLGAVRRQGVAIERSIEAYGACIVGLGVVLLLAGFGPHGTLDVPAIAAAAVLLAGAGAADNVSSIFRSTLLQAAAPDSVRGRLQGVFVVVVTGGPRIGDLYVGLLASTTLLWLPPALGGLLVIGLVALLVRRGRFRAYDATAPTP
jgi:MFS family permease